MRTSMISLALFALFVNTTAIAATERIQPFILASATNTNYENCIADTLEKLQSSGFEVVGNYSPFADNTVIIVTSEELKTIAARSKRGGYGAGQRVAVSKVGDKVEVSYINPIYIQYAYRLQGDMQPIASKLEESLGKVKAYGVTKTKTTAKKLKKYHYMFGMQYFDDPSVLAKFSSHEKAVAATEAALNKEGDGLSMIYRIDIPGTEQTVFGVSMNKTGKDDEDIDDSFQLGTVDFEGPKKTAYLPYEVLVNGKQAEALSMRFRMAVHFPDLSMMGDNSFMKLMSSPKAIEKALEGMYK